MASSIWQQRLSEVNSCISQGQGAEAMKVVMQELRDFAQHPCIFQLNLDTSTFYTNSADFGRQLKIQGGPKKDVRHFAEILHQRGKAMLAMGQLGRAMRDLGAALELAEGRNRELLTTEGQARLQWEATQAEEKRENAKRLVPVTVLTGFLGAGKTTLLNHILQEHHGRRYAVIENELGQVGLDQKLLAPAMANRTAESITLLDNGCLCCTVRSDLIDGVKQILNRVDMEHVNAGFVNGSTKPALDGILIETTGIADPGPVVKTFYADDELRGRTRVDGVVTVVDAKHFLTQLQRRRSNGAVNESAHQVAFADRVLLNKADLVDEDTLDLLEAEIGRINAAASIRRCSLASRPGEVPLEELLLTESFSLERILQAEFDDEAPLSKRLRKGIENQVTGNGKMFLSAFGGSRHDTGVSTCMFCIEGAPLVLSRFTEVMNSLRKERAVDLYRYKGVLCVKEPSGFVKKAVMQGVHDMTEFEPRGKWPADALPRSEMVFIGRSLDAALWGRLFEKCKAGALGEDE